MEGSLLSTGSRSGSCSWDPSEMMLFACNICSLRPINPVETACGHLFCWPCLYRLLQGQAKPCPVCTTMLSSEINVVPMSTSYGSMMLFLPAADLQMERNEDELDGVSTNVTVVVPGPAGAEEKDVLILYMGNKMIRRQTEKLQKRVRRAKRLLRKARI